MQGFLPLLWISLLAFLPACSGGEDASSGVPPAGQAAEAPGIPAADVGAEAGEAAEEETAKEPPSGPGTLAGRVLHRSPPEAAPLDLSAKPEHAERCMQAPDRRSRTFVTGPEGGLANVFVEVRRAGSGWAPAEPPGPSDQVFCRYEPHVLVVPLATPVLFENSDPFMHNVHFYCRKNPAENFGIPAHGEKEVEFRFEERIRVRCDVHPWMDSWVIATDNPFHALTGPDGSFRIEGIPAGEYEVRFWHEGLGSYRLRKVQIGGGETRLEVDESSGWES